VILQLLDWNKLLCTERERERTTIASNDYRNDFESDYDRVVFSSPFRRLQDKAQVFPLERNDFVRTRLTHSIEVATIARSLGVSIATELLNNGKINPEQSSRIPIVLETAGLSHDIGNPPFGHHGETTIQKSFREWFENHNSFNLNDKEKADFLNFDGNCQMFRILTHLQCIKDEFGLNLTYATLSALMKYPFDSISGNKSFDKSFIKSNGVYYKKFGYFEAEEDVALRVLEMTGLMQNGVVYRHPLAFVLEAADDIAYMAGDLEDGYKKKLVSFDLLCNSFNPDIVNDIQTKELFYSIQEVLSSDKYYSSEKKLQEIRIKLQGFMKQMAVDAFVCNYDDIMYMRFKGELLETSKAKELVDILKPLSINNIYQSSDIERIEIGGEHAIRYLIERFMTDFDNTSFIQAVIESDGQKVPKDNGRMYRIISDDFRKVYGVKINRLKQMKLPLDDLYNRAYYYTCLMVSDYISGMTDSYCTELYRRLQGV
jgi:dGTPase